MGTDLARPTHEKINKELSNMHDWPPLSFDTEKVEQETKKMNEDKEDQVIIMGTDLARPTNQAFDSLFSTPVATDSSTHSAAAISLNPPSTTPRRQMRSASELVLSSPCKSFTTAPDTDTPSSNNSTTGKFVSCDKLDSSSEPEAER